MRCRSNKRSTNNITEFTNKYVNSSEPEYEVVETNARLTVKRNAIEMIANPTFSNDVKMDANPAYQATR